MIKAKSNRDRSRDGRASDESGESGESGPHEATGTAPDFVGLALKYKWLLLVGLGIGLALGHVAYLSMGPAYLSTTRVLVSKRSTSTLKEGGESTVAYGERGEHMAIIMSPLIVGDAIKKRRLDRLPSLAGTDDPVEEVLDNLKIKRTAGSDRTFINVLDISYVSSTRGDATAVVTAIAGAYRDYLAKTQNEHTTEKVAAITKASNELHQQLQQKEQSYIAFREKAPLQWRNAPGVAGATGDITNVHQERVTAIEADRRVNLLKQTEIHSKLKAIEQARESGESNEALELLVRRFTMADGVGGGGAAAAAASTADASLLHTLETRLLPLILEEKKLLRDFGPDHPDVVAVQKSIQATRDFYRQQGLDLPDTDGTAAPPVKRPVGDRAKKMDFVAVYIDSLKQELTELGFRERELNALFAAEAKTAKTFSRCQLEDQTFNDEIKRLKTLWELVVNRLNEVNLLKDNGGYTLKTMAPPREELDVKRRMKILGGGAALGLFAAFGVIVLRALCDTTLKTIDDVQRHLEVTVIGRVPQIDFKAAGKPRNGSPLDPSLLYFHHPSSPEAEAYRSVRTALFVCTHGGGEKVIQVTSCEPQDGKTTLICNLAVALAQAGKKVLLIDADLRCPKVFKLFGFNQAIGLSDVLAGEVEWPTAVHETEVAGLSILGSGLSPANPAEMLGSARFQETLRAVRADFDFVLVDTPPILAVSDPCIVAPATDGLLFVVRLGKNRRAAARRAQELLDTHEMRVLGVVVNGVSPQVAYGNGYGYGYGAYISPPKSKPDVAPRPLPQPVVQG